MDKNQAIELANKKGFQLWATFGNSELQFLDKLGINLYVNPEKNTFRLAYLIPKSIFQFNCPECSPFTNEEHFDKMYRKFKKEVVECWSYL